MQNPPLLPTSHIAPRRNPGVVQQRALPIPLPTQPPTIQQPTAMMQPMMPAIVPQQIQQPTVPQSPSVQQMPQANPVGGEVYTMADLHNLAITQGRRLLFRRRRSGLHSDSQCQ